MGSTLIYTLNNHLRICIQDVSISSSKVGKKTPQPVNTLVHMALNSLFGSFPSFIIVLSSLVAQRVRNLPALQETWVQLLGQKDPLEKETETLSSILAWKIPWTQEPGRLQSMGSQELDTTK